MALFLATDTFAYISLDDKILHVDGTDVTDRGPWAAATTYALNDVILYQNTLYVCLTGHTNMPPTAIRDDFWSSLVLTSGFTPPVTLEEVYELANEALDLAQQALETAWAGTEAASSLAYPALVTAWAGTATADVALSVAGAGTDLATVALETAWAGTALAYDALQQAWYGTQAAADIGYPALVTAWVGTATANVALSVAGAGTDAAYAALQAAWAGTEAATLVAYPALTTAWAGTAAAAAGIDLANDALVLAQAGTVPPPLSTLPDVNIPAPTVSQVLAWDGSQWIAADAPSTTSPSAFTYYLDDLDSGIPGYDTLVSQPSGTPEILATATVAATTGPLPIQAYIGGELERTLIDAGIWEFKTYASVSSSNAARIITEIYQRTVGGAETFLFAGTSANLSSPTPTAQLATYVLAKTSFSCVLTDKLVAKYLAVTDSVTPVTVTMYLDGTAHCSHFHTPLRTSHNDLAGLQGGQTDEYYHATADQNAALLGTLGHPSAANRYVTADAALQTAWAGTAADAALQAQIAAGTQAGSAADLAIQAQIAAQGTLLSSTTTTAYTALQTAWSGTAGVAQVQVTAVSGSNTANAAMALAQTLNAVISAGQQGTTVAYFGQVANSNKTDIKATFAAGVLISVVGSRYNWEDFERYDLGIVGQGTGDLGLSTSWSGTGVIYTADQQLGFYGTDAYESYAIGTVSTGVFAGGRRWGGAGAIAGPYLAVVAAEPFTGYGTATGITGAYISAGTGWSAAPTLFAY